MQAHSTNTSRIKEAILTSFLIASVSFTTATVAVPKEKFMPHLRESIRVDTSNGRVVVKLEFNNTGDAPVFIPTMGLIIDRFDLDTNGSPVDYVGIMVKRGPLSLADYVELAPHATHNSLMDITDSYGFKSGQHAYRISLSSYYLRDVNKLDITSPVKAPVQTFSFAK